MCSVVVFALLAAVLVFINENIPTDITIAIVKMILDMIF